MDNLKNTCQDIDEALHKANSALEREVGIEKII